MAAFIALGPDRPLSSRPDYSVRDILFQVWSEDGITPEDILVRRTSLAISGALDLRAIEDIVAVMADELNWSNADRDKALSDTVAILVEKHGQSRKLLVECVSE